jgi:glycosyltransferase involved in cell wall biosynthesis
MGRLRTIVVDLEAVLPGAENGGAKIFVLTLIRQLAADHPDVRFILLTQPAAHEELASLDAANVSRILLEPESARKNAWIRLRKLLPRAGWLRGWSDAVYAGLYRSWVKWGRRPRPSRLEGLHADLLFAPFTNSRLKAPLVPMVSVIYDLQHKTYPQFFAEAEVLHRNRVLEEACRFSSAIAVISDYVRDTVLKQGLIEPERVKSIHIRMPHRFPDPAAMQSGDLFTRSGLAEQSYLLYPANFWPHKNHEMLLVAFLAARRSGLPPHVKLVFTGAPSPRMEEVKRTAQAFGLSDEVRFLGFVEDGEFQAILRGAAGLVFPSLYEGFGMPVIEAMAAGCPVACSAGTSLLEVAEGAAMIFDPRKPDEIASAIVALCKDQRLRTELVAKGHERARALSQTRQMAQEYWELFETSSGRVRHKERIYGLFGDGWASPNMVLEYAEGERDRTVELDLFVPPYFPIGWNRIEAADVSARVIATMDVPVGERRTFRFSLGAGEGKVGIRFRYYIRPAELMGGDDVRDVSMFVSTVSVSQNGTTHVLFGKPRTTA